MPINEKEYNGNLFDQLEILDEIELIAKEQQSIEAVLKWIAKKRRYIERKLYQQPPLVKE